MKRMIGREAEPATAVYDRSEAARRQPRDDLGRFCDAEGAAYVGRNAAQVEVGGTVYLIPTDERGFVRKEDLIRRFTESGRGMGADMSRDADRIIRLRKDVRPEDIAAWWADPGSMDIEGIDDAKHSMMSAEGSSRKGAQSSLSRIGKVGATPEEIRLINRTLESSFTNGELRTVTAKSPPVVTIAGRTGEISPARYVPETRQIVLVRGWGTSRPAITHEFNHALKHSSDRDGPVTASCIPELTRTNDVRYASLEEAENTLETVSRLTPYRGLSQGSYYAVLSPDRDAMRKMVDHDRKLITGSSERGSEGMKGDRLVRTIEDRFDQSEISRLSLGGGETALEVAESRARVLRNR